MRVEKTKENAELCKCYTCPSYSKECKIKNGVQIPQKISDLGHLEKMFCAYEKSNCIHEHKGCKCETCQIYQKYDLNKADYCLSTGGLS